MVMPFSRLFALSALALVLASSTPARAYELHRTAHGGATHWTQERVIFRLSPTARERLGQQTLARAVVMATEAWRGLPGSPDLVVSVGAGADLAVPAADGVNGIYVSDDPLGGDHLAETRLSFEPSTGKIVDVDIVISGSADFEVMREGQEAGDAYDLGAVLTHEIGHALGLADVVDVPEATMFARFRPGETHARSIEIDDERGVLAAYRGHAVDVPQSAGCSAGGQATPPLALSLALSLLALSRRRRRVRIRA